MKKIVFILLATFFLLFANAYAVNFTDVSSTHWAYPAIMELTDLGILSGIKGTDGNYYFNGNDPLTRYQTAVVLDKLISYAESSMGDNSGSVDPRFAVQLDNLELAVTDENGKIIQSLDLEARINSLESEVNKLFVELSKSDNSSSLNSTVDALKNQMTNLSKDVSLNAKDISELSAKIDSNTNSMLSRVQSLEADISALENLDNTEFQNEVEKKVSDIEARLNSLALSFVTESDLQKYATLADVESRIKFLAGQDELNGLSSRLLNVETILDENKDSLNNNDSRIAANADNITVLTKSLTNLKSDVANLSTSFDYSDSSNKMKFDEIEATLLTFEAENKNLSNEISSLSGNFDSLTTQIGNNTSKIGANEDQLEVMNSKIATLQGMISSLNENIGKYATKSEVEYSVGQVQENVDVLSTKVGEINAKVNSGIVTPEELNKVKTDAQTLGYIGIAAGVAGIIVGIIGWTMPKPQ